MRFVSEFRDGSLAQGLVEGIKRHACNVKIMEVCGGHTHVICKYGIQDLLPKEVRLVHGPGCPVCVTPSSTIAAAIELAERPDVTVACFGDMMRVPTEKGTLLSLTRSGSVKMIYSPLEAVDLAASYPESTIVFLAIGFETTAPSTALAIRRAAEADIHNFKVLSTHVLIPPAMMALLKDTESSVDAFIAPGHVTAIIGLDAYEFLARDFGCPVVVSGFEPLDLLQAIFLILQQVGTGAAKVENQYRRAVTRDGNPVARAAMAEMFEVRGALWRGLGFIPGTGLGIRRAYANWDAERAFHIARPESAPDPPGCRCGDVLRGIVSPPECPLFGTTCTPSTPIGPCMVSPEGACAAHNRYRVIVHQ